MTTGFMGRVRRFFVEDGDRLTAIVGLVLVGAYLILLPSQASTRPVPGARGFDSLDSTFVPRISAYLFLFGSIGLLATSVFRKVTVGDQAETGSAWDYLKALIIVGMGIAYVPVMEEIGYVLATMLLIALMSLACGCRDWRIMLALAVVVPPAVYYAFSQWFYVPLPNGLF